MLTSWPAMLASKMEEWKLDRAEMVDLFGTTRDEWMAADLDGWLAPNRMYDGIAPAMSHAMAADDAEVYIVTTKQARPPPPPRPRTACGYRVLVMHPAPHLRV